FAGIRLNLQGREPAGTLAPGAEADRFIAELTRNLQKLVHDGSGHPVVRQVHRTADLFRGACQDELPDLLVEWHTDPPLGTTAIGEGKNARIAVRSPGTGTVEMLNFNCRTGEHRIEGMFVARGPGIAPGRLERVIPDLDLAPTFARYLGVDMPGVDGAPIPELAGRP
ncbi:MAG TPA: hypothetical protein VLD58_02890, partial [Gemmatimonadales bacterium]|nr:hypothetical protein [Gemmatimonadales bacterium]